MSPDRSEAKRGSTVLRRLWVLIPLVALAVGAVAVEDSVTVHLRWRVQPYQTLRLLGSPEASQVVYRIPTPTALDQARGYLEDANAVTLEIASNTPWKIQVELADGGVMPNGVSRFAVGRRGEPLHAVRPSPVVLADGANGTYEVSLDYRVYLDPNAPIDPDQPIVLVYTLMAD